jgi:hypothetical protein
MLSSYIKRQIKKMGVKAFMIKVLDTIAKITPSKEDDKIVAEIKKTLKKFS